MSKLKLIGSTTSPYVRRIRLQLGQEDYDFETVQIFTQEGQETVAKYSKTARIPLLVTEDDVIWDSYLIAEYLSSEGFTLEQKKDLVLLNELTDAGVQLFQLRTFDIDPQDKGVFSQNNLKRIGQILDYFEQKSLNEWDVVSQWLFCTLDWMIFRDIFPWKKNRHQLAAFYSARLGRMDVQQTDPRVS